MFAKKVIMVRPVLFGYNAETAVNNYYQNNDNSDSKLIQDKAVREFDELVNRLREAKVEVSVIQDSRSPHTPDSIFPNNWFSTHVPNKLVLYPMFANNRRLERNDEIYKFIDEFDLEVFDYTKLEEEGVFLEGTGSLVLDNEKKIAYCALSPRADKALFEAFCYDLGYKPVSFRAYQSVGETRKEIYHTNVMMAVCNNFVTICLDSIDDPAEREMVKNEILSSGKEILEISEEQVVKFLGNMLQLYSTDFKYVLAMSRTAEEALTREQKEFILKHTRILSSPIPTIEYYGGGSVRCMLAEVFI